MNLKKLTPLKNKDFAVILSAYIKLKDAKRMAKNLRNPIFHGEWGNANNQTTDLIYELDNTLEKVIKFIKFLKDEGYWIDKPGNETDE